MLKRLDRVASETLSALHREAISDRDQVRAILESAARLNTQLSAGIDRRNEARVASIRQLDADSMLLSMVSKAEYNLRQLFFSFELEGVRYFFACSAMSEIGQESFRVTIPLSIYRADRRDLNRTSTRNRKVMLVEKGSSRESLALEVEDETLHGISITVPESLATSLPREFEIWADDVGAPLFARVRHRTPERARGGWTRVGLSVSKIPTGDLLAVQQRDRILDRRPTIREGIGFARAGLERLVRKARISKSASARVRVVEYRNDRGQVLRAIENRWGDQKGGTAVIIPPAWGRTKETMLPLAMTLVETFRHARRPIRVVRFDGTNRRGESHIDPECLSAGDEYLHFTFSQAARDISATASYLKSDEESAPEKILLVTFSLAAVEARHALATDKRFSGWISVVGMADLQSALRTISGGIDFGNGLLRGVRFGRHELVGVVADMDHTGLDAIKSGIGFLEDVRRDMASIEIPITWLHGRYDAWMDLDRVVETMSCGRTDNRRIIELPTGHQLRIGQKALATFQLIAEEASEMALGNRRRGRLPRISRIAAAREAELARLPQPQQDVRSFWADYLLGRSRVMGMELLAATAAYRNFMEAQVRQLGLCAGERVADLGAGIGEFATSLTRGFGPKDLTVIELDFILDALMRSRSRHERVGVEHDVRALQCVGNLDLSRGIGVPLGSETIDAVLASLVISYVSDPARLLGEIYRVLKHGGRIVVSSMLRDADGMLLFHDGVLEYATTEARGSLGQGVDRSFDRLLRDFLNDGSRLLELEERGRFRFWEERELRFAVANAGFQDVRVQQAFGEPPQAVIVTARRP
jgi:ubiquinone/menaquinone biosynthesis C-methylase UbiE/pimeloyl-ACP methyl ester carboxylesterase